MRYIFNYYLNYKTYFYLKKNLKKTILIFLFYQLTFHYVLFYTAVKYCIVSDLERVKVTYIFPC